MEKNNNQIAQMGDTALNFANLPDLDNAEVVSTELNTEYWTPEEVGESKRVFFNGFGTRAVLDLATGEERELDVVKFVEKQGDEFHSICNGSSRLVGIFSQLSRDLQEGMPFLITYVGRKKTKNGKYADSWSVKPLIVK